MSLCLRERLSPRRANSKLISMTRRGSRESKRLRASRRCHTAVGCFSLRSSGFVGPPRSRISFRMEARSCSALWNTGWLRASPGLASRTRDSRVSAVTSSWPRFHSVGRCSSKALERSDRRVHSGAWRGHDAPLAGQDTLRRLVRRDGERLPQRNLGHARRWPPRVRVVLATPSALAFEFSSRKLGL